MTTPGPRPDVHLLADLDAGLLDEARAREVRAAAAADPAARAVLDALAATRAQLAALPEPSVPAALAARWSAALAAEQSTQPADPAHPHAPEPPPTPESNTHPAPANPSSSHETDPPRASGSNPHPGAPADPPTSHPLRAPRTPPSGCEVTDAVRSAAPRRPAAAPDGTHVPAAPPVGPPHPGRGPRARRDGAPGRRQRGPARLVRRPAVLAAALLVAVAVVAGWRARPEAPAPPPVDRPQLVTEAVAAVGVRDTAGLDDPARRAGCLRAVGAPGIDPAAPLLGGRRVTFEGHAGVLLVLGTGVRGAFDVLIVDPDCGPADGRLLAATHVAPP